MTDQPDSELDYTINVIKVESWEHLLEIMEQEKNEHEIRKKQRLKQA